MDKSQLFDDGDSNQEQAEETGVENVELTVQLPPEGEGNEGDSELDPPPDYESLGFGSPLTPPQVPARRSVASVCEENHNFTIARMPPMTPDDARDHLLCYVSSQSCFGKSAASQMVMGNIVSAHGLHYTLETFTETRLIDWAKEAFKGGQIDDARNGRPPPAWNIDVTADQEFVDQTKDVKMPHTETVKSCNTCKAVGVIKCVECEGTGTKRCEKCFSNGVTYTKKGRARMCKSCGGSGRLKCETCKNSGHVKCTDCLGYKQLKWFVSLKVKFVNNVEDEVIQHQTGLKKELFRNASGDRVYQHESKYVMPLATPDDEKLNAASKQLIEKHMAAKNTNERILKQRHTLRAVPVTEVHWTWKSKASRYWIYGYERHVHCPHYPQSSCYGCTLL